MFKGVYTAIITPFKNGKIDLDNFEKLIERQKNAKVSGIVIGGCTGESFTLTLEEKIELTKSALKFRDKDFKIIVGTGTASTSETIETSKKIESLGVDCLLIITPYGNKPSQEGLYNHYKKIAENVSTPIMLYNVPGRTSVNMLPETIAKLSNIKNIVALKQALNDMDTMSKILQIAPNIDLLSGEDSITYPLLAIGGKGVVCTCSNIIPETMVELCNSFFNSNLDKAREIHLNIQNFIKACFIESNPTPLKYAYKYLNLSNGELREPLIEVSESSKKVIENEINKLKEIGYLKI
ncbi:MAG: 4-hydroxy-tetrahydrodipicolinate synthase [Spirochaetes bacterium]|nr:4-hydroxy-tetrahydrodipicolinate synthase [Spirochaetota bacterium]